MAEGSSTRDERFVKKLNFSSESLALDWKMFKAQFEIFKVAKKYGEMSAEEQIANLLVLMGPESVPIYAQFQFNNEVPAQAKTLANVIRLFDTHFEPVKNVIYERVKFNNIKQGGNTIHKFITELQSQADSCEYGTVRDDLVRDRIVVGVTDNKLREYLIDTEDLTLQKAIQRAKQYVSHHEQAAIMNSSVKDDNLDYVSQPRFKRGIAVNKRPDVEERPVASENRCPYCYWKRHAKGQCPARNATCYKCKGKGHWAKACKRRQESRTEEVDCDTDMDGLFLGDQSL